MEREPTETERDLRDMCTSCNTGPYWEPDTNTTKKKKKYDITREI